MQYERSISAVYYLLQGKQSIQTIQDAQLFKLTPYYGIYKNLSKTHFYRLVNQYVEDQILQARSESDFIVTKKGEEWIENHPLTTHFFNGIQYKKIDQIFFSRLLLLIQVWTNHKKKKNTYIPIVDQIDILNWMKVYYEQSKNKVDNYLHVLYQELVKILSLLPPEENPAIVIDQFTSAQTVWLTTEHIAFKESLSVEDVHLKTINIIHFMLQAIMDHKEQYWLLYSIVSDLMMQTTLTHSAQQTND